MRMAPLILALACALASFSIASIGTAAPISVNYEITGGFSNVVGPITGGSATLNLPLPGSTAPPVSTPGATFDATFGYEGPLCSGVTGFATRGAGGTAFFSFSTNFGFACGGYAKRCVINADPNGNLTGQYTLSIVSGTLYYSPGYGSICNYYGFTYLRTDSFTGVEILAAPVPTGPWLAPLAMVGLLATAGAWIQRRR